MRRGSTYGSYFIGMSVGSGDGGGSGGDVISVNGKKGNVIITSTDIRFNNTNGDLTSTTIQSAIDELNIIMESNKSDVELKLSASNGKVKMNAIDSLGYLEDKVDNITIQNIGNKLVAKSLDGLISSIEELNHIKGAKSNIQAQIDGLSNVGNFTESVPRKADLDNVRNPSNNDIVIVLQDESKDGVSTIYMYNGTNFEYVGEFKAEVRDFTTDPINLETEVFGKLPLLNISSDIITINDISRNVANKITEGSNGNLYYDGREVSASLLKANEF